MKDLQWEIKWVIESIERYKKMEYNECIQGEYKWDDKTNKPSHVFAGKELSELIRNKLKYFEDELEHLKATQSAYFI